MIARPFVLLAALAASVASAAYPSMHLAIHIKRASMSIYGSTDFDVYVNPVVSDNSNGTEVVSFDGETTLKDTAGNAYTFSVVDRVPYYSVAGTDGTTTTTCLPVGVLPPVDDVVAALTSATPVDQVDTTQDINCTNGTFFQLEFAGEGFVLCSAAESGASFTAYGEDLDVTFSYLTEIVAITAPTLSDASATCESLPESTVELTSTAEAILTGETSSLFNQRRRLHELSPSNEPRRALLADATCACKGVKRPCVFYQGIDVASDTGLQDSNSYFKGIEDHAPCCSSFKYAMLNTVDNAWNNASLQQRVCDTALEVSNSSTGTVIEDTIIVSHSMAVLMVSGALATDKCSLGSSSTWVAISGPLHGSKASDFQRSICDGGTTVTATVLQDLGNLINECPGTTSRRSIVYENETYATAALDADYAAAQAAHLKYSYATMCGDSYSGLVSSDYLGLWFGGWIFPHHSSKNDGLVRLFVVVLPLGQALTDCSCSVCIRLSSRAARAFLTPRSLTTRTPVGTIALPSTTQTQPSTTATVSSATRASPTSGSSACCKRIQ